ncbi:MAG: hypothetical protein JWP40_982 [Blastococcus sp.]|nr:hypothetical protein [Blastococcus sp.]
MWDILDADREIGLAIKMHERHGQVDNNFAKKWRRLAEDLKPAQRAARDALTEAIAVELRSR